MDLRLYMEGNPLEAKEEEKKQLQSEQLGSGVDSMQ